MAVIADSDVQLNAKTLSSKKYKLQTTSYDL